MMESTVERTTGRLSADLRPRHHPSDRSSVQGPFDRAPDLEVTALIVGVAHAHAAEFAPGERQSGWRRLGSTAATQTARRHQSLGELEETIALSHSILVMRDGKIQTRFDASPGHKPRPVDLVEKM